MYSNNLFPLITTDTVTLIDDIFTSKIELSIKLGLLLYDLVDHLPVFAVIQNVCNVNKGKKKHYCTYLYSKKNTRGHHDSLIGSMQPKLEGRMCHLVKRPWVTKRH